MQALHTLARSLPPHVGANGGALAALRLCCQGGPLRAPTAAEWPWVKRTLREQAEAEATAYVRPRAPTPATYVLVQLLRHWLRGATPSSAVQCISRRRGRVLCARCRERTACRGRRRTSRTGRGRRTRAASTSPGVPRRARAFRRVLRPSESGFDTCPATPQPPLECRRELSAPRSSDHPHPPSLPVR